MLNPAESLAQEASDEVLAAAAAGGSAPAFARLVERHYPRLYRLAYRWAGRREDAEDIAQEIAVKLGSAIRTYRREARFSTWLHRLAYTTTIDALRERARREAPPEHWSLSTLALIEAAAPRQPDGALEDRQLWQSVLRLPPRQRDAVLLVHGEGLSHEEAGAVLQCGAGTVSFHLHEARKRLKAGLAGEDERA